MDNKIIIGGKTAEDLEIKKHLQKRLSEMKQFSRSFPGVIIQMVTGKENSITITGENKQKIKTSVDYVLEKLKLSGKFRIVLEIAEKTKSVGKVLHVQKTKIQKEAVLERIEIEEKGRTISFVGTDLQGFGSVIDKLNEILDRN